MNDENRWIPYLTIENEATILRKVARDVAPTPPVDILDRRPADKHIVNAIRKRIDKFFPRNDAEELVFGPGVPDKERAEIRAYVLSLKLKFEQRQRDGHSYFIVYCKLIMSDVVAALKQLKEGQMYGKYMLVPKSECPKHADVLKATTTPAAAAVTKTSD